MLRQVPIKNVPGDRPRKWMTDDYFDLYVWYQEDGTIFGFQLCYDKDHDQRALTWTVKGRFQHDRVDSGEESVFANRSPVLTKNCPFYREPVRKEFLARCGEIEPEISTLVLEVIDRY